MCASFCGFGHFHLLLPEWEAIYWLFKCCNGEKFAWGLKKMFHKAVFVSRPTFLWGLTLCIYGHGDVLQSDWCQVSSLFFSPAFRFPIQRSLCWQTKDGLVQLDNAELDTSALRETHTESGGQQTNVNRYPETAAWSRGGRSCVNASAPLHKHATCDGLSAPASARSHYVWFGNCRETDLIWFWLMMVLAGREADGNEEKDGFG